MTDTFDRNTEGHSMLPGPFMDALAVNMDEMERTFLLGLQRSLEMQNWWFRRGHEETAGPEPVAEQRAFDLWKRRLETAISDGEEHGWLRVDSTGEDGWADPLVFTRPTAPTQWVFDESEVDFRDRTWPGPPTVSFRAAGC